MTSYFKSFAPADKSSMSERTHSDEMTHSRDHDRDSADQYDDGLVHGHSWAVRSPER
jgi:hypothetical protein